MRIDWISEFLRLRFFHAEPRATPNWHILALPHKEDNTVSKLYPEINHSRGRSKRKKRRGERLALGEFIWSDKLDILPQL